MKVCSTKQWALDETSHYLLTLAYISLSQSLHLSLKAIVVINFNLKE